MEITGRDTVSHLSLSSPPPGAAMHLSDGTSIPDVTCVDIVVMTSPAGRREGLGLHIDRSCVLYRTESDGPG